mmetsp:Transcript_39759/g.97444  ORF Transcript_39759/g.97444 Transcript_39759/m.97444 type:complete len:645 (+) Transcript_39759:430-2364(+)
MVRRKATTAVAALTFLSFAAFTTAQLTIENAEINEENGQVEQIVLLQEDGAAMDDLVFSFVPQEGETLESAQLEEFNSGILTDVNIPSPVLEDGAYNVTAMLTFEGDVGNTNYALKVVSNLDEYVLRGSYLIAGVAVKDADGNVVSGMGNNVEVGTYLDIIENNDGLFEFDVETASPNGGPIAPEDLTIDVRSPGGEIAHDDSCPSVFDGTFSDGCAVAFNEDGSKLFVQFTPYVVGSEPVKVNIRSSEITDVETGMDFQNELNIVFDNSIPAPPFVAEREITADFYGGEIFTFNGFNWDRGDAEVSEASLKVGDADWPLDVDGSSFGDTASLLFDTTPGAGSAGEEIEVNNGTAEFSTGTAPVLITGEGGSPIIEGFTVTLSDSALAEDSAEEFDADEVQDFAWLTTSIRFAQYEPGTFSKFKSDQVVAALASNAGIDGDRVRLSEVQTASAASGRLIATQGSSVYPWESVRQEDGAVATYQFLYDGENFETQNESTYSFIESGALADEINVRRANIEPFGESEELARPGTPSPSAEPSEGPDDGGGGLPTWARVVIGVAAGLLGLLLIACCIFFILARDRDDDASTEPSFTVEGPASVPVPVEYPVVRDAFGRGAYETELNGGEVDPSAGLPVEQPRINSSL